MQHPNDSRIALILRPCSFATSRVRCSVTVDVRYPVHQWYVHASCSMCLDEVPSLGAFWN